MSTYPQKLLLANKLTLQLFNFTTLQQKLRLKPDELTKTIHTSEKISISVVGKANGEDGAGVVFFNGEYQCLFKAFGFGPIRQGNNIGFTGIGIKIGQSLF